MSVKFSLCACNSTYDIVTLSAKSKEKENYKGVSTVHIVHQKAWFGNMYVRKRAKYKQRNMSCHGG